MKKILFTLICIISINRINAQNVNIPDAQFKAALVNNAAINTNGDAEIQVTEAAAFTGFLNVSNKGISNLTGIEAFTALDSLSCYFNQLTSLDVTANMALTYLTCNKNQLTSLNISTNVALDLLWCYNNHLAILNVSNNTALTRLSCYNNQLTSLNISANNTLTKLYCAMNQLTSLDVSTSTALMFLSCNSNQLSNLDVSANANLTVLDCIGNQLSSLDVSGATALTNLNCQDNQLTSLVSANPALTTLNCYQNQLMSLDVSSDSALITLNCAINQLTSLNLQSGYNDTLKFLNANYNPNLTCIQVDNVANSNAYSFWLKDSTASYSTNCLLSIPTIDEIPPVQIIPNPATGLVTFKDLHNIQKIEVITMQGQIMKSILVNGNAAAIDVSTIANGIYQVKLSNNMQSKIERLVVAH